jgi:type II secretory pathway pseudopilin PulG
MKLFTKKSPAGDTMVEVVVAISIMGLALGSAYALSNRSFHTAQSTQERTEALSLVEGQVEFLRNAGFNITGSNSIGAIIAFAASGPFCFIDQGNNAGNYVSATNDYCEDYGPTGTNSLYDISVSYCGLTCTEPQEVFTIRADWAAAGSGRPNNITLYYKP